MSRTFMLHNNNAETLLIHWWKNNWSINSQVTYTFSILNKFIDFSESIWIITKISMFMKITFLKKNWDYNRVTVSPIIQKILVCDIESCYKDISEILNVTFSFQNLQNVFQNRKEIEKIHMESKR